MHNLLHLLPVSQAREWLCQVFVGLHRCLHVLAAHLIHRLLYIVSIDCPGAHILHSVGDNVIH